jgi:hypothetical protein
MVGVVTAPFEFPDSEFVIFDTSKFLKLVGICNQFLTMDIQLEGKIATKLLLADSEYNLEYALANLMLAPNVNFTVSEFESDYEFEITTELVNNWIKAKNLDFSGLESATDFLFYKISGYLKAKKEINPEKIKLAGCKYATIWSLHYLNQARNKTIFDFDKDSNVTCF